MRRRREGASASSSGTRQQAAERRPDPVASVGLAERRQRHPLRLHDRSLTGVLHRPRRDARRIERANGRGFIGIRPFAIDIEDLDRFQAGVGDESPQRRLVRERKWSRRAVRRRRKG